MAWRARRALCALVAAAAGFATPAAAQQVQIAGLSDIAFGTWRGAGDLEAEMRHCVRRTGQPAGRFNIVATGSGSGGAFRLTSGMASLPYRLSYNDGSGWRDFAGGNSSLAGLQGVQTGTEFNSCLAGQGAGERLRVRILETDLARAPAGRYAGLLLLTVSPE